MTNFPPETYLAAARIAYPGDKHSLEPHPIGDGYSVLRKVWTNLAWEERGYFGLGKGNDYRALREALDKEYRIAIHWADEDRLWESYQRGDKAVPDMNNEDITWIMLMNVQALIEAGVVE